MVLRPLCARSRTIYDSIPEPYRYIENWPGFDKSAIKDEGQRARFDWLVKALDLYLGRLPYESVLQKVPIGDRQFKRLVIRGLWRSQRRPGIEGLAAFVKFAVQRKRKRTKPLSPTAPGIGYTGAWGNLLRRFPEIETRLTKYCLEPYRQNTLTPHLRRAEFKRIIADLKGRELLSHDEYPNDTDSECEKPIEEWYQNVFLRRHGDEMLVRQHGESAGRAAQFASGDGSAIVPQPNQLEWIIDEVTTDLHAKYEVPSPLGDWEELELPRFQVIRCRTFTYGINVTWRLVLRQQSAAQDIAIMLYEAVSGVPCPPNTVPDIRLKEGADFPVNRFPTLKFKTPIRVYLDNALAHLADVVQHIIVTMWGGEVVLGAPANPKERAAVESSIKTQAERVMHQLPDTTGTGPQDHRRKTSAVPIRRRCDVRDLKHVLHVYFANENVFANGASHHLPPFTRLERVLSRDRLLFGEVPPDKGRPEWYSKPVIRKVKLDLKNGRKAYVNYNYATYSSDHLKAFPQLAGQELVLRPNDDDLRVLLAFHLDGHEIGELRAQGHWGQFPNDFLIRKIYGDHRYHRRLGERPDDAPMHALFRFLKDGAPRDPALALQFTHMTEYFMRNMTEEDFRTFEACCNRPNTPAANDEGVVEPQPSIEPVANAASTPTIANASRPSATVHRINVPRLARR